MVLRWWSRQALFGLVLVLLPVLYEWHRPAERQEELLSRLAASWETISPPQRSASRVAIGVNANLDLIVSAIPLLETLGLLPGQPIDHTHLGTVEDLQEQVAYSMEHCAGTERVFSSQSEFERVVTAAYQLPHSHFIGGNAALMAAKIQHTQPHTQVMLAGPIGSALRTLLPPQIHTPTHTPDTPDEVHLILEYPKGQRWGKITSNCANRVIVSHDIANAKMVSLEGFRENLELFKPDLVILSGAHLMQGETENFKRERLVDVARLLDVVPATTPVHSELATIGDLTYLRDLAESTFSRIDSLGLNEQELVSLARASGAKFDFDRIPSKPTIAQVSDLLHWLVQTHSSLGREGSRLTRVHFHTLSFHILATVVSPSRWGNTRSAVLAGARVAGLQACDVERFDAEKYELRVPVEFRLSETDEALSRRVARVTGDCGDVWRCEGGGVNCEGVIRWERGGVEYALALVLVCRAPVKTVGLGDAISSMGLLYSQFTSPQ